MGFKNKKILVIGSSGMIGKELIEQLKELGARVEGFDIKEHPGDDITDSKALEEGIYENYNIDYVFHLFGIKGNPKMTKEKPVDFMGPMLLGDTNSILLAQAYGVKKFLYTSSIAVEHPGTDKYPAWAKLTAETLIEAMRIQHKNATYVKTEYCIVRPSNVYGRYDNCKTEYPMVVTSLIKQALKEKSLTLYNQGDDVRDFINAKDVARGMIQAMEEMPEKPANLCSGKGVKILDVAKIICKELDIPMTLGEETKPTERVMDVNWDFKPEISLEEGIKEAISVQR